MRGGTVAIIVSTPHARGEMWSIIFQRLLALLCLLIAIVWQREAQADSVGLYVSDCAGGGYSFYYHPSPATIGTYEQYNNGSCLRWAQRSWYSYGAWYDFSPEQSFSNITYTNLLASLARGKHQLIK